MTPDERQRKLRQEIHTAMDRADELQRHINRQNKTDNFAMAFVFMTLGLCGLGALAVSVFACGGL